MAQRGPDPTGGERVAIADRRELNPTRKIQRRQNWLIGSREPMHQRELSGAPIRRSVACAVKKFR